MTLWSAIPKVFVLVELVLFQYFPSPCLNMLLYLFYFSRPEKKLM